MSFKHRFSSALLAGALALAFAGCGDDDDTDTTDNDAFVPTGDLGTPDDLGAPGDDGGEELDMGTTPDCEDSYGAGYEDTVAYNGQVGRHALIRELSTWIGGLSDVVDADSTGAFDEADELVATFQFYYAIDADSAAAEELLTTTDPELLQQTWGDLRSVSSLEGKLAGNDDVTDHRDWDSDGAPAGAPMGFDGWGDASALGDAAIDTPQALLFAMFDTLAANGVARASIDGQPRPDEALLPAGDALPVYVTADGLDLQQLIQKYLLMAIPFQQATDDYLDDDVDGKGLRASNVVPDGDDYSPLMHAWDEGFGYFGAARDYACYTDDEIAGAGGRDGWQGYHDTDGDGAIDLYTEYNSGASVNAAKRDRGATDATDYTQDAIDAFIAGRDLIASVDGELSEAQLTELRGHRDDAVDAYEKAIAATVVHYINDTIGDMDDFTEGADGDYSFLDHAKHWGEMKGFSIGLQFNPASPLNEDHPTEDGTYFEVLQGLFGGAPVLPNDADVADYRADLLEARALLQDAYGFAAANVENW